MPDLAGIDAREAFHAWLRVTPADARDEGLLDLRERLRTRSLTAPDEVDAMVRTVVLPGLAGAELAQEPVALGFYLLTAGVSPHGGTSFADVLRAAEATGLSGLAAVTLEEWARWSEVWASPEAADALYRKAQDRFAALAMPEHSAWLFVPRARIVARHQSPAAAAAKLDDWLSHELPTGVQGRLCLERAQSAAAADQAEIADHFLATASALFTQAGDLIGLALTHYGRGLWYWRFGALTPAYDELGTAVVILRDCGAFDLIDLAEANRFSISLRMREQTSEPLPWAKLEPLRARLARRDRLAWWQLTLDMASAAGGAGDPKAAMELYVALLENPAPRTFELKLAGLNFAQLRLDAGIAIGLRDDIGSARLDPVVRADPYLRMLAFELSGALAEQHGHNFHAARWYSLAVVLLDRRRQAAGFDGLRVSLRGARQRLFRQREAAFLRSGHIGEAWRSADDARSATLRDMLRDPDPAPLKWRRSFLRARAALASRAHAGVPEPDECRRTEVLLDRIVSAMPRSVAASDAGPVAGDAIASLTFSRSSRGLGAYVVRDGRITWRRLTRDDATGPLLRRIQHWSNRVGSAAIDEAKWRSDTGEWADIILGPLLPLLEGVTRLGIVPCAELSLLPWSGLYLPARGRHLDDLITDGLHVLPSVSVGALLGARAAPARATGPLCAWAGNSLAYAALEADIIGESLGPGAARIEGGRLTSRTLRRALSSCAWLHLIGHGQFRPDLPMASRIDLGHGEFWTGWDLAACRLPATTVVLSACELGGIEDGPGGEWFGMLRGFLAAGARSVVAPLWRTRDLATLALMTAFYAALAQPSLGLDQALRTARQTARSWGTALGCGDPVLPPPLDDLIQRAMIHWRRTTPSGRHANVAQFEARRDRIVQELAHLEHPRHWALFQLYGAPGRPDRVPVPG